MKFKKWIMTSLLVLIFLTTNFVSPEIVNFVTRGKSTSTSIVYALPRTGGSGFKSGSFKSSTFKSGGYKSGSFKSGSSIFGGFSTSKKGSSYGKSSSTRKSYIPLPIPIPSFSRHYYGGNMMGGLFAGYLVGKLIKWIFIIFVFYIIYRIFIRRRY